MKRITISFRRAEFIAFGILALLAIIFAGSSLLSMSNITYESGGLSQREIVYTEMFAAWLLNVSTELVGAVAIYLVFKVLFGLRSEQPESDSGQVSSTSPQDVLNKTVWKEPLKETVSLLVKSSAMNSASIGLFRRFPLPDGTELLDADEIRELRAELEATKGE